MTVRERLAGAPIRDVCGVVDAWGAIISRAGNEELWTLKIVFEVWKLVGGQVQNASLLLRQERPFEELKLVRESVKPYAVYRVRAHVLETDSVGTTDAWLVELTGEDNSDPELNDRAQKLSEPVLYQDKGLGTFVLERRLNWFEGEVSWETQLVRLRLGAVKGESPESTAEVAHELCDSSALWHKRVYECAVSKLLDLKNGEWLQNGESELTAGEFASRLKLQDIVIKTNGKIEFWFDDGDLFWGHAVRVTGNLTDGPISAGLEG